MKLILSTLILMLSVFFLSPSTSRAANYVKQPTGYILLQVEAHGEAWYIYPSNGKAYYLGRPADAFKIMGQLALGAKHDFIVGTDIFPDRLAGMILLDVEKNGEAYYIYPLDMKKYYLGRPEDAFRIMSELGLGVTNSDLANIPTGEINEPIAILDTNEQVFIDNVPFTSQAPLDNWSDSRQQEGCEEASALMAVFWARKESFTPEGALQKITDISDFILNKYGEYRDTSSLDTMNWIIKDYFQYNNVTLMQDVTASDIIEQLSNGNLVITAMNGQMVDNPNYRYPGPSRHMIVILGYDPTTNDFITNDPGTKKGQFYRYDATELYSSIRDYKTGYREIVQNIEKNIIVISK
ncbi:C39 family peptidase [Patescibacteria group bacterium]|nr:C39 family peptidase [Patescibacteria group bacterium]